jgi:hypothetical protein
MISLRLALLSADRFGVLFPGCFNLCAATAAMKAVKVMAICGSVGDSSSFFGLLSVICPVVELRSTFTH